jgi:hypothetical protein
MRAIGLQSIVLAGWLGIVTAGCGTYQQQGEAVPTAAPAPPAEVDVTTPMPGPNYVWIGGAWVWGRDGRWEWAKGHWEQPPFLSATWVPPRCENRSGNYFFIPGRWE